MADIQVHTENNICYNLSKRSTRETLRKQFECVADLDNFIRNTLPNNFYYYSYKKDEHNAMVKSLYDITSGCKEIEREVVNALNERFSHKRIRKTKVKRKMFSDLKNDIEHHQQAFKPRKKDKNREILDTKLGNILLTLTDIKQTYLDLKNGLKGKYNGNRYDQYECKTPSNSEEDSDDQQEINRKLLDYTGFEGESVKMKNYYAHYNDRVYMNDNIKNDHDDVPAKDRCYRNYEKREFGKGRWRHYKIKEKSVEIHVFRAGLYGKILKDMRKYKIERSLKTIKDLENKIKRDLGLKTTCYMICDRKIKHLKNKQIYKCWVTGYENEWESIKNEFMNIRERMIHDGDRRNEDINKIRNKIQIIKIE